LERKQTAPSNGFSDAIPADFLGKPLFWFAIQGGGNRMQFDQLKRRECITLLAGAAAAWPLAARSQQQSPTPVIGFPSTESPSNVVPLVAFRQGLKETSFVEGENVTFEHRFALGQYDRLPILADAGVLGGNSDRLPAPQAAKPSCRTVESLRISEGVVLPSQ
jgi:hypothetical protein